jgi:hypothetical protein
MGQDFIKSEEHSQFLGLTGKRKIVMNYALGHLIYLLWENLKMQAKLNKKMKYGLLNYC